jgi:hypothetical protein
MFTALSLSVRSLSNSSDSMVTYRPLAYSYPETIWSFETSPWIGQVFLLWMRELQSRWSWFR